MTRTLTLALTTCSLLTSCASAPRPVASPPAPRARVAPTPARPAPLGSAAPEGLLALARGNNLRRGLTLAFGGELGDPRALPELSRRLSPGVGERGDQIDPDGPFAVVFVSNEGGDGSDALAIAWPLRSGSSFAAAARTGSEYREVAADVFAPTSTEPRGACWVARRPVAGWSLLCARPELLPRAAGYVHHAANVDNARLLELHIETTALREHLPQSATGFAALAYAALRDASAFDASLEQDDERVRLRATVTLPRTTDPRLRALLESSLQRDTMPMVPTLPARATSWLVTSFDGAALPQELTSPTVPAGLPPAMVPVARAAAEFDPMVLGGDRMVAWSSDDGGVAYRVIRRADAGAFVDSLRAAVRGLPAGRLPNGASMRDDAVPMPTPGLSGMNALRLGRRYRPARGETIPESAREQLARSTLFVAESDRVVAIQARDPVAAYLAMRTGPHATPPARGADERFVAAVQTTPDGLIPLLVGGRIPDMPVLESRETASLSVRVRAQGDAREIALQGEAPVGVAYTLRDVWSIAAEVVGMVSEEARRAE